MKPAEFTRMRMDVAAGVATLTLNRPEVRNAWAGRSAVEYRWALHYCDTDPDVRVVVINGEGDFCVGADHSLLDDIGDNDGSYDVAEAALPDYPEYTPPPLRRNHFYPLTLSVPVIAAITGGCAGAGFLIASYADIRFAETEAKIASSFAALGLPAEYGLGWLLPRIVGSANAAQLLYSPQPISATRAAELGWVQRVCPPGTVLAETVDYARTLASGSAAQSLRMMKRQIHLDSLLGFPDAYGKSVADMNSALKSSDFKEGVRALRDKRKPNFLRVRPFTTAEAAGPPGNEMR
jgi:enoyl-CoA hydratase/carnithine racemase